MNKYQHRGGGEGLTSSSFNIQLFAYKIVGNPYTINPIKKKNYKTKADVSSALVDLSYYARDHIPNYQNVTTIPQDNLNYLQSGLFASGASFMLADCSKLNYIPRLNIDFSNTSGLSRVFSGCSSLTSIDVSWINTDNMTWLLFMFEDCTSLTTLDLTSWNVSNVNDMHNLFDNCSSLTSLNVSNWNISKLKTAYCIFDGCKSIQTLDLSSWDTSKVTEMWDMFINCSSLTTIKGVFDLKSVSTRNDLGYSGYRRMFTNCRKLMGVKIKNPPQDYYDNKSRFESEIGFISSSQYEIVS